MPFEAPGSVLFWASVKHRFPDFRELGKFLVRRIHNYFLVEELGLEGSLLKQQGGHYLLTNGYTLKLWTSNYSRKIM